ncbi:MAG: 2-hydroxyacid dehydrogenase [Hyphomicrobiaceae bacterium]
MSLPWLVVTFSASSRDRSIISAAAEGVAHVAYLDEQAEDSRRSILANATVLLSRNTAKELRSGEEQSFKKLRLVQYLSAGIDFIPLKKFPEATLIAGNGGGYAEPMAEHALMMALAAHKRLIVEHKKLEEGTFDQFRLNRMFSGSTCGILGFGGIGQATARLMRAAGSKIHAINRSGQTNECVDWIGTTDQLAQFLGRIDTLVVSLPLTPATAGLLGHSELSAMKNNAVLVNLARGEILDEKALFFHLQETPEFTACIDAWWIEPVRHGEFRTNYDFLRLPNVLASPHNSASVTGWSEIAMRRALANACRALRGVTPRFVVPFQDRMM